MNEMEILQPILDCFSGADSSFIKLRALLKAIVEQADNGDEKAQEIVIVAKKFAKLVEIATVNL